MTTEGRQYIEAPEIRQPDRDPYSFEVMIHEALDNAEAIKSGQHNYPIQKLAMWAMLERYIIAEAGADKELKKEYRDLSQAIVEQLNARKEEYDEQEPEYKTPFALSGIDDQYARKFAVLNTMICSPVFGCCGGCKHCGADAPTRRREHLIKMPLEQAKYFFDEYCEINGLPNEDNESITIPFVFDANDPMDYDDIDLLAQHIKQKYGVDFNITTSIPKGSEETFKRYLAATPLRKQLARVSLSPRTKEFLEPYLARRQPLEQADIENIGLDDQLIQLIFDQAGNNYTFKYPLNKTIRILQKKFDGNAQNRRDEYVKKAIQEAHEKALELVKNIMPIVFKKTTSPDSRARLMLTLQNLRHNTYYAVLNFAKSADEPGSKDSIEKIIYYYSRAVEQQAGRYKLFLEEKENEWLPVGLEAYKKEYGEIGLDRHIGSAINPFVLYNVLPLRAEKSGQKVKNYPQDRLIVPFYGFVEPPKEIKKNDYVSSVLEHSLPAMTDKLFDKSRNRQIVIYDGHNLQKIYFDDDFKILKNKVLKTNLTPKELMEFYGLA
ncbi:MAG: hypothetical protein COU31_01845 [Candidatus Magasanikbacteria bacterium CG10_big_fil_rev_8_21_14_0_10_40_10]|uniref:Uncharacterized protein n=1 Tax=Candidatus Magasanikbacteria bacterium CG10_big_fil_rev_8_21_14_0_10_40_10 TaxID=1974648 RepID=A0A2M6W4F3_9BACT|nr:MAG: hypothetical protein COU31_01845 [Candidatus Magasanikbacteria bacterium CG10_big_fil_rev_8_21_14_0_10_40_10]